MNGKYPLPRPAALLSALALFFFLSVLVIPDSAEQYRAWRVSLSWTDAERAAAGALQAARQQGLSLGALLCATLIVCASALGAFLLGIGLAKEGRGPQAAAALLCASSSLFGMAYAALILAYRLGLGGTRILRGPLRDFDLSLRPPVLIGGIALALLSLAVPLFYLRGRALGEAADGKRDGLSPGGPGSRIGQGS